MIIFLLVYLVVVFIMVAAFLLGTAVLLKNSRPGDHNKDIVLVFSIALGVILFFSFIAIFSGEWSFSFQELL